MCVCFSFFLRESLGRCCICYTQRSTVAGGGGDPWPVIHNVDIEYTVQPSRSLDISKALRGSGASI